MVRHRVEADSAAVFAVGEFQFVEVGVGELIFGEKLDVLGDIEAQAGETPSSAREVLIALNRKIAPSKLTVPANKYLLTFIAKIK
jgi:hypothetical protein